MIRSVRKQREPEGSRISKQPPYFLETDALTPARASRGSEYSNDAPPNSARISQESPDIDNPNFPTITEENLLDKLSVIPPHARTMCIGDEPSFHLFSNRIASSIDEVIFLLTAKNFGLEVAIHLGSRFGWQFQRPLQALLSALSEPDKSCSKRSVAQEPLSG